MEIEVSNQVCKLANDALHARLEAAGHRFSKLSVRPLWELMDVMQSQLRPRSNNEKDIDRKLTRTPQGVYYWLLGTTVRIAARLSPQEASFMLTVPETWEQELAPFGCEPFTSVEREGLGKAMESLVARSRHPSVVGIVGKTLLYGAKRNLPPVFGDEAAGRRKAFLEQALSECHEIENTVNRADARSRASKLAQALSEELRLSGCGKRDWPVRVFWVTFELFDITIS